MSNPNLSAAQFSLKPTTFMHVDKLKSMPNLDAKGKGLSSEIIAHKQRENEAHAGEPAYTDFVSAVKSGKVDPVHVAEGMIIDGNHRIAQAEASGQKMLRVSDDPTESGAHLMHYNSQD